MAIADNLKGTAPKEFLDACEKVANDPKFRDHQDLIPWAALAQILVYRVERLALRTEVECKTEIYLALGKPPLSDDELLRKPARNHW